MPSFKDAPITGSKGQKIFSGTFFGETLNINDHGFYSGESVYYTPQKTETTFTVDDQVVTQSSITSSLFGGETGGEGTYYVFRIDNNNLKLAKSPANLYTSNFASVESTTTVTSNIIELVDTKGKNIDSQKIYREVATPIDNTTKTETAPGYGILINGVEILNYKSKT